MELLNLALGTFCGGAVGFLTSLWFGHQSSKELKNHVAELQRHNADLSNALDIAVGRVQQSINAFADAYEKKEDITFERDDQRNVITIRTGSGGLVVNHPILAARGTVLPPPVYDRQHEQPPPPNEVAGHDA